MPVSLKSGTKVLITGGAGFIGSHLAEAISRVSCGVTVLDIASTGRLERLLAAGNVRYVSGSITDLPLLERLLKDTDLVFHLAAIASVPKCVASPEEAHAVNVTGTFNVLLAARDNKVKKVIFASSAAVYGNGCAAAQKENMLPEPLSPYAANKLAGEHYCRVFTEVYGLPTAALRLFNVYGPGQDPASPYAGVISRFMKLALEGKPPVITGDGKQSRDFVFVEDLVRAMILIAGCDATGVYNIGSGVKTTVNEIAREIIRLSGNDLSPAYSDPRTGDVGMSVADISRARALGFAPAYSLRRGLELTLEDFKHDLNS